MKTQKRAKKGVRGNGATNRGGRPVAARTVQRARGGNGAAKVARVTDAPTAPAVEVTRETLDATPARALALLRGLGTNRAILARLRAYGLTQEDTAEGWALLHAASGFEGDGGGEQEEATAARAAISELDASDETLFRVLNATLRRRTPNVAAKLLDGVRASAGAEVVLNVSELLDRIDALAKRPDAEAKLALSLLDKRGYGAEERARLRELTERAKTIPAIGPEGLREQARADAALVQNLQSLRVWYEEWAEIAKAAIVRRDHLIRLGLAARRSAKGASPAPEPGNGSDAEASNSAP